MDVKNNGKFVSANLCQRLTLGWGRLRRAYFVYFRKNYVTRQLATRQGECQRCGACCRLMFDCWHWVRDSLPAECKGYRRRSQVCRIYPIDQRDLKDRAIIRPDVECGFRFTPQK